MAAATDPVTALGQAIYFLDRELASTNKVRAFQRAIDVVIDAGIAEIEARVKTGTITELPGIGASTGAVIVDAVNGVQGEYLISLDERSRIAVGDGAGFLADTKGDCHSHTVWSDGGATVTQMANAARALGHEWLVITDHSPRLTVAHGLSEQRLAEQLAEIAVENRRLAKDPNANGFQILTGCEVDILEDGSLDLPDTVLSSLDVVVASTHSKLRIPRADMTRRLVLAVANPNVDILGHCTNRKLVGSGRPPSDFDSEIVWAACERFDTAVEINCRPDRLDPPDDLLEEIAQWDVRVAIDTDAHAPGQLEWQAFGCDKAAGARIRRDRVITAMSAKELRTWTSRH